MKFSKTTGSFYPADITYTTLPTDLVDVTEEEYIAAMNRQLGDTLDVIGGHVVVISNPGETITQIKARVWENIKAKRDSISQGGVLVGAYWYHTDNNSRIRYLALLKMMNSQLSSGQSITNTLKFNGQIIKWKTMTGVFVDMTGKLAIDISDAVTSLDFNSFNIAENHRNNMELSDDPENYDFSTGWPTIYNQVIWV